MKKEKKNLEALNPQDSVKKDYQLEEDNDVKEKNKTKKAIWIVVILILFFFLILLIWYIKDHSVKEEQYDVDGVTAVAAVAQANKSDGTDASYLAEIYGETIDVAIPLDFYKDEQPSDTLTKDQLASGYVSVFKADGNVVYTIKTAYYPSVVENLYEYYEAKFNAQYEKKDNVELVSMSRDSSIFTITLKKDGFHTKAVYDLSEALYYQAAIYQSYYVKLGAIENAFDGESKFMRERYEENVQKLMADGAKVKFQLKFVREPFTVAEYIFPDELGGGLRTLTLRDGTIDPTEEELNTILPSTPTAPTN